VQDIEAVCEGGNDDAQLSFADRALIEILLVGTFWYFGRRWMYDDSEESTFITMEMRRVFSHKFVEFGSKILFPMQVSVPSLLEEFRDFKAEFRAAGFPRCISSADATHIPVKKVSYGLRQAHLGIKSASSTHTYNLTINHRCKILHSTQGHPDPPLYSGSPRKVKRQDPCPLQWVNASTLQR
jgi:hypothetical protein